MDKTPYFHYRGCKFDPWWGTKISHTTPCSQKNNDNKTYIMYAIYNQFIYFYYSNNIIKYYFNCLILYSHNIDTMTANIFKIAFLQPHYPQEKKKKKIVLLFLLQIEKNLRKGL